MDKATEKLIDQIADIKVNHSDELEKRIQAKKDERQQAMIDRWEQQAEQAKLEESNEVERIKRQFAPILSDSLLYDLTDDQIKSNQWDIISQSFRNMQTIFGLQVPSVQACLGLLAVGKPQFMPNGGGVRFHPAVMGKTMPEVAEAIGRHPIPADGTILDVVEAIQIDLLENDLGLPQ